MVKKRRATFRRGFGFVPLLPAIILAKLMYLIWYHSQDFEVIYY